MSTLLSNTIKPRSGDTVTFADCNVSVGGVLTYEDVTNVDSVGLITARSGIEFGVAGVGGTISAIGIASFSSVGAGGDPWWGAENGIRMYSEGSVGLSNATGATKLINIFNTSGAQTAYITADGSAEFAGIVTATRFSGPGNIPQNIQAAAYTLVSSDAGKHIFASGDINTGVDNVFSAGDAVTIVNNTASNLTITRGITTMYNAADGSNNASYTLAGRGMVTILFVAGDEAFISGAGLS